MDHTELTKLTKKRLEDLLQNDSYLSDIPPDITSEECKNLIALAYGQSISIILDRGVCNAKMKIIVPVGAETTVGTLKKAIQTQFDSNQGRTESAGTRGRIKWKYIWKAYWLEFDGDRLEDDVKSLEDIGIRHGSLVKFVKRKRVKNKNIKST